MKIINLLPKPRQEEFFYASILLELEAIVKISGLVIVLVLLGYIATGVVMNRRVAQTTKKIEILKNQVNKQDNAELKKKIKQINQLISDYQGLDGGVLKWSGVLQDFANLPPEGVRINSMQFDLAKKAVTIMGFSPTREKVIELYENIKADDKNFYNIDYPLENVAKATEINFHFNFLIRQEALK